MSPSLRPREPRLRWASAAAAGLLAGVVFMMVETILAPAALGGSPWRPSRMIAAILLGPHVLSAPSRFDGAVLLAAMTLHFTLSVLYALALAGLLTSGTRRTRVLIGIGFGLVLYFVNFYGFTHLFPWFGAARNWVTITSHVAFGLVVVCAYDSPRGPSNLDLLPYGRTRRRTGRVRTGAAPA